MPTITVPKLTEPTRLDKFLVNLLPNLSRHLIQQNIKQGAITVNKNTISPHHWLKPGDVVDYPTLTAKQPIKLNPNSKVSWQLIKEAPDYLVINKPSGLTVHPADNVKEPTLIEGLINKYPELITVGEDSLRPGIVHRLDKEASGLMVIARNQNMYEYLKNIFQTRQINKQYLALVVGQVHQPSGSINFPIGRSKHYRTKMAVKSQNDKEGKTALTNFTVVKQYQAVCLVKIKIVTGRTHQIRTHFNAYGHPLVGDNVYRPKNLSFKNSPGRLFLHASELSFKDLAGDLQEFSCPLPKELQDFLNQLS